MTECRTIVDVIVSGTTYNLTNAGVMILLQDEGLGMPPQHRLSERGPLQHGVTDLGFRLDPRTIQLVGMLWAPTHGLYYDKRVSLLDIFAPADDVINLRWKLPNGATRQIDCFYTGALTYPSTERKALHRGGGSIGDVQRVAIELIAPDPVFYDPAQQSAVFNIGSVFAGAFTVPMFVPLGVSADSLFITATITYTGTWSEYPVIIIRGPIINPKIENLSTDEKLDFSGTTIAAGDFYIIDTRYGFKTVTDSFANNKIATLTNDSDLATFHLARARDIAGGTNEFKVSGNGLNPSSSFDILYYNRYLGI